MRFASFDADRVKTLNSEFVPVIVNSFFDYNSGWFKRKDFMGGMWKDLRGGNGDWTVMKPDGTYLDKEVAKGLAKWNALPEAERKPGVFAAQPKPAQNPAFAPPVGPPAGAILLRSHQRNLKETLGGDYALLTAESTKEWLERRMWATHYNDSVADTMWVLEDEWKSLIPAQPRKGDRFPLPAKFQKRLLLWHLTNRTFCVGMAWAEKDIRKANLTLVVEESAPIVKLKLEGPFLLKMDGNAEDTKMFWGRTVHGYEGNVLGFLEYDPGKRKMTRFDVLAIGDYWGGDCEGGRHNVGPLPLAISFEMGTGETLHDRILPCGGVALDRYLSLKPQY